MQSERGKQPTGHGQQAPRPDAQDRSVNIVTLIYILMLNEAEDTFLNLIFQNSH